MNTLRKTALLLAFAAVALTGCASKPKSYVVLLESPDGTTGQVIVKGSKGEQLINKARQGTPLDGSAPPAPVDDEKLKKDFGDAMAARPALPEHFLLYFESGGTTLTAESAAMLEKIIEVAGKRPVVDMSVIGHTDTPGKAELNEALALKRANAIADLLKEKGLKVHALAVESHGERNLLVQTPDDTPEPRNRRVEISVR
jgi:outer membrane protein OmpA-like peptidoglycan-associated protein